MILIKVSAGVRCDITIVASYFMLVQSFNEEKTRLETSDISVWGGDGLGALFESLLSDL